LLPDSAAQEAANLELESGTIEALREDEPVGATAGVGASTKTIFRLTDTKWATSALELDFARSPIEEDQWDRVYWTGDSFPKMSDLATAVAGMGPYPAGHYRLGIPRPASNVTTAVSGTADDGAVASERAYIFTYVSQYGEEGPPSVASLSDVILVAEGQTTELTFPANPSGNYNLITKRIYRSDPDGVFRFVADVGIAQSTYNDTVLDANLGEAVPSSDWDAPPDDVTADHPGGPLKGLIMLADGSACGFTGNTLCFSEQNLPHAWPERYQHVTESGIVGVVETRRGVVVVTEGKPYMVYGTSPDARTPEQIDDPRGCVSKRSLVDMGDYALYATNEGILLAGGAQKAENITRGILSPEQWRAGYEPSSIHAYFWEDKYVAFYDDGAGNSGGFILDPRGGEAAFIPLDFYAQCGYYDREEGALYLVIGGSLVRFARAATRRAASWKSKVFRVLRPICPGAAKVAGSVYPITFKLWADGVLKHTETVADASFFRLPSGYKAHEFEVELSAVTGRIDEVAVGESPSERF
jgi:hypothetical protein